MTIFRCPKCKSEIGSTRYIKIKAAGCSKCRTNMISIHNPGLIQLALELQLNKQNQNI